MALATPDSLMLSAPPIELSRYRQRLERLDPVRVNGRVAQVIGLVIESIGPTAMIGLREPTSRMN